MDLKRLKELLVARGISQTELARLLGRDKAVVTNLLQGRRQMKADEATLIARHLGVPVTQLLGADSARAPGLGESPLIPFRAQPSMARKHRQIVEKSGEYFLDEAGAATAKSFALEVQDEALNLAGILPGDIVISELDRPYRKGDVVVIQHYVAGGAQTLLRKYDPPFLAVHSTIPRFKPFELERDDVRIVSPVVKLVRLL